MERFQHQIFIRQMDHPNYPFNTEERENPRIQNKYLICGTIGSLCIAI